MSIVAIKVGDEVRCDRAMLLPSAVRIRRDGVWVELRPPDIHAELERMRAALMEIDTWSRAYPLSIFPEPDFKKAAALLTAGGMTLDAISASNMRHVVEGVGKIARRGLDEQSTILGDKQ